MLHYLVRMGTRWAVVRDLSAPRFGGAATLRSVAAEFTRTYSARDAMHIARTLGRLEFPLFWADTHDSDAPGD